MLNRWMLVGLALVIGTPALGADPYVIKELLRPPGENLWKNNAGYDDARGKVLRTTGIAIDPTRRTLVLISAGQSNSGNITPTAYVAAHASAIDNFSIYDGKFYEPSCPVLGAAWDMGRGPGHIGLRVADALISAGKFDRVILVPVGAGSGTAGAFEPGGVVDDRFRIAIQRLADSRITPASIGTTWAITWMQGESDPRPHLAGILCRQHVSYHRAKLCGWLCRPLVRCQGDDGRQCFFQRRSGGPGQPGRQHQRFLRRRYRQSHRSGQPPG